ncbi:hypothetical protein XI06_14265 [Bradyrhizobium sp. CCBAU 11434]|nr:hypothetical protein [Bradyrhizobium sp. CCBAU 11434]
MATANSWSESVFDEADLRAQIAGAEMDVGIIAPQDGPRPILMSLHLAQRFKLSKRRLAGRGKRPASGGIGKNREDK